ncbi:MAG TPA: ribosome recycling factor [Candidatus Paceibacterota bacterium]|nr:ribosome recycling factor [Candidatus Paceibacterota bacterium]
MYSFADFQAELKKVDEWLSKEYSQISTGRAAPALLDGVQVESYGAHQPIKNVASVSIEDPKTLRISPWDKGLIKEIERGIYASNLGFSVSVDDQGIRVIIPQLTTERRTQLVKLAKDRLEDARIRLRQTREDALEKMKAAKLPEDAEFRAKDELQKLVAGGNQSLEAIFEKKEQEILN